MKKYSVILTSFVVMAISVIAISAVNAQIADVNRQTPDAQHRQAGNGRLEAPQEVPFTPGTLAGQPSGQSRQDSGVRQTISGLRDAGYTLDIIVGFLKNSGCQANEVSMSCLHAGYRGADIVTALKKSGFSEQVAEDAVPRTLRGGMPADFPLTEEQMVGISNAVMSAAAQGNDLMPLAIGQQSVLTQSRFGRPANATGEQIAPQPPPEGGTFNGLGSWNRFQTERSNDFENKNK